MQQLSDEIDGSFVSNENFNKLLRNQYVIAVSELLSRLTDKYFK